MAAKRQGDRQPLMHAHLFGEFLMGDDSLRVYEGNELLFASREDRLLPLLKYIEQFAPYHQQVLVFDKIIGNAAALLCVKAACRVIYSPLGSELAINTLDRYRIEYHFTRVVPYIQRIDGEAMCPMEELSLDKEPEEFYELIKDTTSRPQD
ncbi:MAG: DUF1893 domain-containing protein [Dehalococcoidia bacterium]|nr:DUF1893 domain-containing protein [Dehalococcoidia bacterium]